MDEIPAITDVEGEVQLETSLVPAWRRRFLRARVLVAFVIAILLFWLAARAPRWALDHAEARYQDCMDRNMDAESADPAACRQSFWLASALLAPWTRSDAKAAERHMETRIAEESLRRAVDRDLDAGARDRAASRLVEIGGHDALTATFESGATDALLRELDDPRLRGEDLSWLLSEAIAHGDLTVSRRVAALMAQSKHPYDATDDVRRGVLECLDGDVGNGLAHLAHAGDDHTARLASIACGAVVASAANDPQASCLDALTGGAGECATDGDGSLYALVLLHRRGARETSYAATADAAASSWFDDSPVRSRWTALASPESYPWLTPDDAGETSSALLAAARRNKDPELAEDLRVAAFRLDVEGSLAHSRRGHLGDASVLAKAAFAIPRDGLMTSDLQGLAAALDLSGDTADSLTVDDAVAATGDEDSAAADTAIARAITLAHAGRYDDARAAIAGLDRHGDDEAAWLDAALALRTGHLVDVHRVPPAPDNHMTLDGWWRAATTTDETERAALRWQANGIVMVPPRVLPAAMYLIGAAAGQGDREMWLDRAFAYELADPRLYLAARAEAARWAGDQTAAAAWDARLAAYEALATDDRTAYLLDLLGQP